MDATFEKIRDAQKDSWNKFSPGWKKWDQTMMQFLEPMGGEIIRQLHIQDNDQVLDVASGTGEPGISIAKMLKNGSVMSTDIAEGMIEVAREHAAAAGVKNFDTAVCDISEMPFPDQHFDKISCRFGFMFFPDMKMAVSEMVRMLKPGGRIATSVWAAPEKNFWFTACMSNAAKHMELPAYPPGSPGLFRCAEPGQIAGLFRDAGLENVVETEVSSVFHTGSPENYWTMMTELAAPFASALSKADEATIEKIRKYVLIAIREKYPSDPVIIPGSALVISGSCR